MSEREIVIVLEWRHIVGICVGAVLLGVLAFYLRGYFSPRFEVSVGEGVFKPGSVVRFSGVLRSGFSPIGNMPVAVEVRDPGGNVVWVDQVVTGGDGSFGVVFRLRSDAVRGVYTVYVSCRVVKTKFTFRVE